MIEIESNGPESEGERPSGRVYLDHNASAPVTASLAKDLRAFLDGCWGNASAKHPDGLAAHEAIERARGQVARAIHGAASELTFTSGGTESNNWVFFGAADAAPADRRHFVVGRHEHLSVVRPVAELERRGFDVTWLAPAPDGALRVSDIEAAVRDDTLLVSVMLANNETGILQPVVEAARIARERGALFFVDAVCGAGKVPLDVRAIGCDLLSISGHKVHTPKGVGALWVKGGVDISPLVFGCGQQGGRRSGTENTLGAVALGLAMERYGAAGKALGAEARELRDTLWRGIEALDVGAERNGTGLDLSNTLSVWFPGRDALGLQVELGAAGLSVAAQAGSPEAPGGPSKPSHVLRAMGLPEDRARESLRFSLGSTTVAHEISVALEVLAAVLRRERPLASPGTATGGTPNNRNPSTMTDISPSTPGLNAAFKRPERESDCSLDRLTEALAPLLAGGVGRPDDGARVAALLRAYAGAEESWRRYARFGDETYTRNLIWRSGDFELLLLCWDEGQESPIHDHSGQQCWMAVLEGGLEEVHYSGQGAELKLGRVKSYSAGGVAFIDDDIALHLVRPAAGGRGVSLHLYSSPIDTCQIFCPDTGKPEAIKVGYHSVRGTCCDGTDPELIRTAWGA